MEKSKTTLLKKTALSAGIMLVLSMQFTACQNDSFFLPTESICLELPDGGLEGKALTWEIVWADGIGGIQSLSGISSGQKIELSLAKNQPAPILAYPDGKRSAHPFGAIYPFKKELSEQDGFASFILYRLYRDGRPQVDTGISKEAAVQKYAAQFNWQKFIQACSQVESPWTLDQEHILNAIANRTFKKNDLKKRSTPPFS